MGMNLVDGITYNLRGLLMGLRSANLLFWGIIRFIIVIIITIGSATLILSYHQEILNFIWNRPERI